MSSIENVHSALIKECVWEDLLGLAFSTEEIKGLGFKTYPVTNPEERIVWGKQTINEKGKWKRVSISNVAWTDYHVLLNISLQEIDRNGFWLGVATIAAIAFGILYYFAKPLAAVGTFVMVALSIACFENGPIALQKLARIHILFAQARYDGFKTLVEPANANVNSEKALARAVCKAFHNVKILKSLKDRISTEPNDVIKVFDECITEVLPEFGLRLKPPAAPDRMAERLLPAYEPNQRRWSFSQGDD